MTYRVKYFLDSLPSVHYRLLHALTPGTAREMLLANLAESGYTPTIVRIEHYERVNNRWEKDFEKFKN